MKSLIMSLYMLSVAIGNFLTAGVNQLIQIPEIPLVAGEVHPGYDGKLGTADDLTMDKDKRITSAASAALQEASDRIQAVAATQGESLPRTPEGNAAIAGLTDAWNHPLHYALLNSEIARIWSDGPDEKLGTRWDLGTVLTRRPPPAKPGAKPTWLEQRKAELGLGPAPDTGAASGAFEQSWYAGGQTRLEGSAYFWFFTYLMAGTAALFVVVSRFYRTRDAAAES
jgi:POT family proton-dependent oligopeptide transporter